MSSTQDNFMKEALKEAQRAYSNKEVPIGAVIVYQDRIIARAHNQVERLRDPTAHAEMLAITQAANFLRNWRLLNTQIYVTLKPCEMCLAALTLARVEKIIYGGERGKSSSEKKPKLEGGVLAEECQKIVEDFFRSLRKEKAGEMAEPG